MDPVIEWYESVEAPAPLASCDYGIVDAGVRSAPKRLFLYNNKGGSGASTATDIKYTTFDDVSGEHQRADVVAQRWLEVRIVSHDGELVADPDGGFKAVGGAQAAHKKDLSGFPLANGAYLELETRIAVPAEPAAGRRSFVQRLEFKFI